MMLFAPLICVVVLLPLAASFRYRQVTQVVSFPFKVAINTLNLVKDVSYLTYDTLVAAPEMYAAFKRKQTSLLSPKRSSFGISATNNEYAELIGYKRGSTNVDDEILTAPSIPAKAVNYIDNYDKNLNFKRPIANKRAAGSTTSSSKYVVNPDYIYNKNSNVDTKETLYKIGDAITSVPEVIAVSKDMATKTIGSVQNVVSKVQSVPTTISSKVNNVKTGLVNILDMPAKVAKRIDSFNYKFNKMVNPSRINAKNNDQTNYAKIAGQKFNEVKKSEVSNVTPAAAVVESMSTKESTRVVAKTESPVVIDPIEKERNERLVRYTFSLLESVFSFSGALIGFATKLTFLVAQDVAKEATLKLADSADIKFASNVAKLDDEALPFTPIELVARANIPDEAKEEEVAVVKRVISRIMSDASAVSEQYALKSTVPSTTPIVPIELVARVNTPDKAKEEEVAVVKRVISRIMSDASAVSGQNFAKIQEKVFSKASNEQAEKKRRALIDDAILRDQIKKKVSKYEAIEMKKTMQDAKVKEIAEVISKVAKDEGTLLGSKPKRLNAYQEFVSRSMKELKAENASGSPRELMKRIAEMWRLEKKANVME